MKLHFAVLFALLGLLLACTPTPTQPTVVRIEVTPGALLLTQAGESQVLSAKAFDAQGNEVKTNIAWSSSNPGVVSLTADGQATAQAGTGSAQVVAQVGQTKAVAVVMVAQPVAGAVLVSDSQIIKIEGTDPNASFGVGYRYVVTLEGVSPPAVGTVLLARETLPVAGRVISATTSGSQTLATVEVLPLNQLVPNLHLKESLNLGTVPAVVSTAVQDYFVITPKGAGKYAFSLRPGKVIHATTKSRAGTVRRTAEFAIGPLKCETELQAISLSVDKAEVEVDLSTIGFEFEWSEDTKKLLMVGEPKVKLAFNPELSAALEGKLECKLEFFQIPLPVPGILSAVARLSIPVGAGFEIGGKLPIAGIGFESSVEYTLGVRAGLECAPTCGFAREFARRETKPKFKWVKPQMPRGVKIEAEASAFFYATINTGTRAWITHTARIIGIRISDFEFFEAKAAVKLEGKLAEEDTQAEDPQYASEYSLTAELSLGTGKDLQEALEALQILVTTLELTFPFELGSSPKASSLKTDKNRFNAGETVNFKVELGNTEFPFVGYNVEKVRIYRIDTSTPTPSLVLANEASLSPGQSVVEIPWTASLAGMVVEGSGEQAKYNFIAFVKTKLLDTRLELGAVKAESFGGATLTFTEVTTTRIRQGGPDQNQEIKRDMVRTDQGSFQLRKKSETNREIIFEVIGGSVSVSERYDYLEINRNQKIGDCEFNETLEDHYVLSGGIPGGGTVGVYFPSSSNIYAIDAGSQKLSISGQETWTARYEFLSANHNCRTDVTDVRQRTDNIYVELEINGTVDPNNPKVLSGSLNEDLGDGRTRITTWTMTLE